MGRWKPRPLAVTVRVDWLCIYSLEEEESRKRRVPKNDAKQSTNFSDDSHKMTEMVTGYMPHVRVETKSASLYRYYRIKYIHLIP